MDDTINNNFISLNPPVKLHRGVLEYLKNMKENREMLLQFVRRDFKIKYRGSILGYLWSLLEPTLTALVYTVLILLIRGGGYYRQPLWLFGGIIMFQFFRETLVGGMQSLSQNRGLIKRIYFPREIFATSNMLSKLIFLILAMFPLIPLLYYYGFEINYNQLYIIPAIFGLGIFGLGLGYLLCCAHTIYSDIGIITKHAIFFLFFLSPILWKLDKIPEEHLDLYLTINPLAVFLTMFRYGVDGVSVPLENSIIIQAFVTSIAVLIIGISIFKRFEGSVIKYL